jgi:hypothetical protein
VLPPVQYPGGEGWAVKMGHGKAFEQTLATAADVEAWHRGGSSAAADDANARVALEYALRRLLPGVKKRHATRTLLPSLFHFGVHVCCYVVFRSPPRDKLKTSATPG